MLRGNGNIRLFRVNLSRVCRASDAGKDLLKTAFYDAGGYGVV
jgi:hypothetical protein